MLNAVPPILKNRAPKLKFSETFSSTTVTVSPTRNASAIRMPPAVTKGSM